VLGHCWVDTPHIHIFESDSVYLKCLLPTVTVTPSDSNHVNRSASLKRFSWIIFTIDKLVDRIRIFRSIASQNDWEEDFWWIIYYLHIKSLQFRGAWNRDRQIHTAYHVQRERERKRKRKRERERGRKREKSIYIYINICMYIYIYIYIYIYTHTHTHTYLHTYMYIYIHTYMYTYKYVCCNTSVGIAH